ncbi:MAG: serine/threonine-protein kinase [Myxococcota bacterium]
MSTIIEEGGCPYRPRRRIGAGAHGEVWLAEGVDETGRGDMVALKRAHGEAGRAHLLAEARILQRVRHPNLVQLRGVEQNGSWLALEHVPGRPVHRWAIGQSLRARLELLAQVAEVLHHLHQHGVVHGDVKPDNVIVRADTNQPMLIDVGVHAGTPGYAAPEQLVGATISMSWDVYGLGALGYRLIAGTPPFPTPDPAAQVWLPVHSLPLPPSATVPRIPERLDELLLQLIARHPAARPTDLRSVAALLRQSADGEPRRPLLGMAGLRRQLRQRLISAAIEGSPQFIAIIGPPRSGRSAVINEVLAAAQRERLPIWQVDPEMALRDILTFCEAGPSALSINADHPDAQDLHRAMLATWLPGLILMPSQERLPWIHPNDQFEIPPLEPRTVRRLLSLAGLNPDHARDITRMTRGMPGLVEDHILRQSLPSDLSPLERSLLMATRLEPRPVHTLAMRVGVGEHDLLDIADPLIDRGLLIEAEGGRCLRAVPARMVAPNRSRSSATADG